MRHIRRLQAGGRHAAFNAGELVVVSLEAAPGRRPQPAVARALVAGCSASSVALTLQRPLRPTLADAPVRPPPGRPQMQPAAPHSLLLRCCCSGRPSDCAADRWMGRNTFVWFDSTTA